jgi:Zn-dependent protease with chaperone function
MLQPTGLYSWIQSNDGKSIGLFIVFLLAMQVICAINLTLPLVVLDASHAPFLNWQGYATRYAPLMLVACALWFGWQMFWHIESVKRAVGFHFVDSRDEPRLCAAIEPLIIMLGLPIPFVGVLESNARNAFACGVGRKKAVVVVTRGLLDSLDDEELSCVLAHELSHIKNGDIRLMAAANIFMDRLKLLHSNNALRFTPIHVVLAVAVPAVLPLTLIGGFVGHLVLRAGQASRLMISSSREYIADAQAVQLTKNPAAMASALVKVEGRYRIDTARNEDDAMMIAGDAQGANATHPTMAQRIAALARTTGSMVFNAPGAISEDAWRDNAALSEAKSAALLRQLPAARILRRVEVGQAEIFLGMTRAGVAMAFLTVAILIGVHANEANNPRAIIAKFDVRPIAIMLELPIICQLSVMAGLGSGSCMQPVSGGAYQAFEGQRNTLAGWLAERSKRRRTEGVPNADMRLGDIVAAPIMKPYTGQSGRLTSVKTATGGNGSFSNERGSVLNEAFDNPVIAELDQFGCFQAQLMHSNPSGQFRVDRKVSGNISIGRYESLAFNSLIESGEAGKPSGDACLLEYIETRETMTRVSYDLFGEPGLSRILSAYLTKDHVKMIDRIKTRLEDPSFTTRLDALTRAKINVLIRAPETFIPCLVLRHRDR